MPGKGRLEIKEAIREDARDLACLINLAGEGIPEYLWRDMAETGESSMDVGEKRAARESGSFSYTNARICAENNILLGMMLSYRQDDPYDAGDLSACPDLVRPLIELEAQAPGSWYINAIATYEQYRGRGVARQLMMDAEIQARLAGCKLISLVVASENITAKRLYENTGFNVVASLPVVLYPGCLYGGSWMLMTKFLVNE